MLRDSVALVLVMLILAIGHAVEIWMWAVAFLQLDLFIELESALYFAAVSYTTLGFGDVLIDPPWRLLSGAAAANGLLLFGMSAALLLEVAKGLRLSGSR
ncbi:MAG: two pore domain potassium channel family protein [Alphaproteobacteria bacterium]|nr:two pore domain potassium channel family protein [Alphaproteobacteria bacterium]